MTLDRCLYCLVLLALCACGPDETQSSPAVAMSGADSEPAPAQVSVSPVVDPCFDDADGFQVNHDGSIVDASGQRLIRMPLTSEADDLAASSKDFCGKWSSETQLDTGSYHYVFRTNADCPRRALPGQFVHLGFNADSVAPLEFVRNFVTCDETSDTPLSGGVKQEERADNTILVFDQSTRN